MREQITYIADDGKKFFNYKECYDYEFQQCIGQAAGQLKFYNEFGDEYDEEINDDNYERIIGDAEYLYIGNKAALMVVDKIGKKYGYYFPKEVGYYYYDYEEGDWIYLNKRLIKLREELKMVEQVIKMMGGEV